MKAMRIVLTAAVALVLTNSLAQAVNPYVIPAVTVNPGPGAGLPVPSPVQGKEISFDEDQGIAAVAAFLVPDPQQVLAWDGTGGLAESFDYSGSYGTPTFERQTDALAANTDALFFSALNDTTHLAYSISAAFGPSSIAGAIPINPGARPQDIEYALRGAQAGLHGKWAVHNININSDIGPNDDAEFDVDGLELWGDEPGTFPGSADSNKFSHRNDAGSGTSVWTYDQGLHVSTPYVSKFGAIGVDDAVQDLLGPLPTSIDIDEIDLDALMVFDGFGTPGTFNRSRQPGGNADLIIFSIRQLADPNDPSGYYATGSELIVYDGNGTASWLNQGGHLWDKAWALQNMVQAIPGIGLVQLDLDALEAVSTPEPATAALLALGGLALLRRRS